MDLDLDKYRHSLYKDIIRLCKVENFKRIVWIFIWNISAKWVPGTIGLLWRNKLLRIFGAKIAKSVGINPFVKIYKPWNLQIDVDSSIGSYVDIYNVDMIKIGKKSIISQKSYLVTASHNIYSKNFELITSPIIIEDQVWIAADAYIGPGVKIGQGAVVAARSVVVKNVEPWTVVGGNPAKFIKKREIKE